MYTVEEELVHRPCTKMGRDRCRPLKISIWKNEITFYDFVKILNFVILLKRKFGGHKRLTDGFSFDYIFEIHFYLKATEYQIVCQFMKKEHCMYLKILEVLNTNFPTVPNGTYL